MGTSMTDGLEIRSSSTYLASISDQFQTTSISAKHSYPRLSVREATICYHEKTELLMHSPIKFAFDTGDLQRSNLAPTGNVANWQVALKMFRSWDALHTNIALDKCRALIIKMSSPNGFTKKTKLYMLKIILPEMLKDSHFYLGEWIRSLTTDLSLNKEWRWSCNLRRPFLV